MSAPPCSFVLHPAKAKHNTHAISAKGFATPISNLFPAFFSFMARSIPNILYCVNTTDDGNVRSSVNSESFAQDKNGAEAGAIRDAPP